MGAPCPRPQWVNPLIILCVFFLSRDKEKSHSWKSNKSDQNHKHLGRKILNTYLKLQLMCLLTGCENNRPCCQQTNTENIMNIWPALCIEEDYSLLITPVRSDVLSDVSIPPVAQKLQWLFKPHSLCHDLFAVCFYSSLAHFVFIDFNKTETFFCNTLTFFPKMFSLQAYCPQVENADKKQMNWNTLVDLQHI